MTSGLSNANLINMKSEIVSVSSLLKFFIAFCLLLVASSCKNSMEETNRIISRANVKIEKGKDVVINYSDNGVVRIQASGPTVTRYNTEKPYLEFSDGIQILFYNEAHEVDSKLTGKYATAIENSKSMTARDSVVVVNNKGEVL